MSRTFSVPTVNSPSPTPPDSCCHNCRRLLLPQDRFCEGCGTAVPPLPCPTCGTVTPSDEDGFCNHCGFRVPTSSADYQEQILSPRFVAVSDRGLCRTQNQDAVAIALSPSFATEHSTSTTKHSLLTLCDGVGSSPRAELAAQTASVIVTNAILEAIAQAHTAKQPSTSNLNPKQILNEALNQAQQEVMALSSPTAPAPSTTIISAWIEHPVTRLEASSSVAEAINIHLPETHHLPSRASPVCPTQTNQVTSDSSPSHLPQITLAWLGDSRAYWLSPCSSYQLTQDHSNAQQQLTHWLGSDADLALAPPQFHSCSIPGPGALLLCSDGLWNYAPAAEQLQAIAFSQADSGLKVGSATDGIEEPAIAPARRLVEFARAQGGKDNITVALLLFS